MSPEPPGVSGRIWPKETSLSSLICRVAAGILAAVIVLSAAACGSGGSSGSVKSGGSGTSGASALAGMSADQIVQESVSDLEAASSVRITGALDNSGQSRALDLTVVAAGGCQGTISYTASASATGSAAISGTADLIDVDGTEYMKYDGSLAKNLGLPSSTLGDLNGKYIKMTSTSDVAQLCSPSGLWSVFANDSAGYVKTGTATIGGQPALAFKQQKQPGVVYISDSAIPEIVRIAGSASQGTFDFSDYNAPATITAPPVGDVIDGSKFGL
jgi:hypothetical protein